MQTLPFSRLRVMTLVFLVALIAGPGAAEPVPDDVSCGDDYWFKISDPVDWQSEWRPTGDSVSLLFVPKEPKGAPVILQVTLDSTGGSDAEFGVEDALQERLSLINAFGSPSKIRPFKIQHGVLPTAGASLVLDSGTAHVAAIDVRNGKGHYFLVTLTKRGGEPSTADLQVFRDTIASIDFDPSRGCRPGENGEVEAMTLSMPDAPPPAAKATQTSEFDLSTGSAGCLILNELYVPIDCQMTDVEGQPTLLVRFDRNDRNSAQTNLDLFAQRVATPFCYEASRHPMRAPRLIFSIANEPNGFAYDCATNGRAKADSISLPKR